MLIFVAYSAKDWERVESLIVELGVLGHDIHFERKVLGGSLTWEEIFQSIQRCDVFVFTVTPNTLASYSRLLEFEYALILRKSILAVQLQPVDLALLPAGIPGVIVYQANNPALRANFAKTLNALPPSAAFSAPIAPPSLDYLLSRLQRRTTAQDKSAQEKAELLLNLQELLERRETYLAGESLLDTLAPDVVPEDVTAKEFKETHRRVKRMAASLRNRRIALAMIGFLLLIGIIGGVRFIQSRFLGSGGSTSLQQITTLLPTKSLANSPPLATGEILPVQPPSGTEDYQPTLPALPSFLLNATPSSGLIHSSLSTTVTTSPTPMSASATGASQNRQLSD